MVRARTTTIAFGATALVAFASGACSALFSTSDTQCASDGDCQARGGAFAATRCSADKVCVGAGEIIGEEGGRGETGTDGGTSGPFGCANLPAPNPDPSRQLDLTMRYTDFSSGTPPTNTLVRLCGATDPNCENARTTLTGAGPGDAGPEGGAGWVTTNADGTVNAKVEYGFEGFFEAKGIAYPPTFRSTTPALRNPKNELEQLLLRPAEIKFLSDEALGKPNAYDSVGHGLVFVFARDCDQQPIANASFTTSATDPMLQAFYVINSSPSIEDTKTDSAGRGGFINVPPGIHTFTGYLGDGPDRKRFGSARFLVRAGAATTIAVAPTP